MSMFSSLCDTAAMLRQANAYLRESALKRLAADATPAADAASMLVQTATDGTYPTSPGAVYVCEPVELDATDTEGATSSGTPDPNQKIYVVNLGTQVPPEGTLVVAHAVGGVWVMRYD